MDISNPLNKYRFVYENSKRIAYWDTIQGFLIFLVVMTHYLFAYRGIDPVKSFIELNLSFHMPVFVFVTGYFSKSERARGKEALIKLICAYLIFNFALMLFDFPRTRSTFRLTTPYYTYWYILAMIAWRIMAERLSKIRFIMFFCVVVALLTGFIESINNTFALSRIFAFAPYFMAGFLFERGKMEAFIQKRKAATQLFGVCIALMGIGAVAFMVVIGRLSTEILLMKSYTNLSDVVIRAMLMITSSLIIIGILISFPRRPIPFFSAWGRNSLTIFLLHRFATLIFLVIFSRYVSWPNKWVYLAAVVCAVVTTFVLGGNWLTRFLNQLLDSGAGLLLGNDSLDQQPKWTGILLRTIAISLLLGTLVASIYPFVKKQPQPQLTGIAEQFNVSSIKFNG